MTNSKLYIGNLPPEVNEGTLRELLQDKSGSDPKSVLVKKGGYAFVECIDPAAADKAIEVLNGYTFMGLQLLVELSVPQSKRSHTNKVNVNNIPDHVELDEIKQLLTTFGNVLQCKKANGKGNGQYSATVAYETQDQAQQAFSQLNGHQFDGIPVQVDFMMEQGRGPKSPRPGGRNLGTVPYSGNAGSPLRSSDFPLRILVLSDMVGAIIGRAGGTIKQITQQSRARVDVHRKENAGSLDKDEMYSVQVITIYGNPENCSSACQKILEVMQQEANNTNRGAADVGGQAPPILPRWRTDNTDVNKATDHLHVIPFTTTENTCEIPLKILAHNNLIGRVIGKNGNTIKRVMEQTDTKITVSGLHDTNSFNLERIITIKGKLENICKAEQMISNKLRQSYENDLAAMAPQAMMFPGLHPMAMMSTLNSGYPPSRGAPPPPPPPYGMYNSPSSYMPMMYSPPGPMQQQQQQNQQDVQQKESVYLYIPNSAVGAIIGTGGSTIRDMISSSGATIKVAQTNKDEQIDRQAERKVTIVGSAESQWKAQFMIFKKVSYEGYTGPQEARLKVEIYVPSSQVGRIIGKGGQTVRELQRQTHAVIKLPEETDASDSEETPVHIIGDFYSTQAAQRQIRALVNKIQMPQRRPGGPPTNNQPPQRQGPSN